MPIDDFHSLHGRLLARQTREDLFRGQPESVKALMRQAAKERREKARKEWKEKNG